jgi:hypothetical protein
MALPPHLPRQQQRQRRLPQPRRAIQQQMVQRLPPPLSGPHSDLEHVLQLRLPQVLRQGLGTQRLLHQTLGFLRRCLGLQQRLTPLRPLGGDNRHD